MRLRCSRHRAVIPRAGGGSSTPWLLGSITGASGILDHPPARVMTTESMARSNPSHTTPRSRGAMRPSYDWKFCARTTEGTGNAGCALHPRSRVQDCAKETHTSIQVQRKHSDIPCAMALRLMPRSPRRRIRLVTVAAGLMAETIRLDRISHRQLDTSNGCQNHMVLSYASASSSGAR